MLQPSDQLRARIAPNDPVSFKYRRKMVEGILIRSNPKRGVVLVEGEEYTVPYELLITIKRFFEISLGRAQNILC
jgi:hypothetical protein